MSMQSDIEILSIQTIENYAAKNEISTRDAYEIFHKHQVFEKIILQHEYLHQVSFHTKKALSCLKGAGRSVYE